MSEQDYNREQSGVWGPKSVSWTCDRCGIGLNSPSDFELVDGENVCLECLDDGD